MESTASDVTAMPDADGHIRTAGATTSVSRAATAAVLAATLLGIAGDGLLRAPALGINVLIWVAAALVAVAWVARVRGRPLGCGTSVLFVPLVFFASVFAWRAADGLLALNALALMSAFGLLALSVSGWPSPLARASLGQMIAGAASVALSGVFGMPTLIARDRALADGNARPRLRGTVAVVRGAIIALPILLVFGALLSSADPGFERLLRTLIDIDFDETVAHIGFAALIAWWAGGYLRAAAVADRPLGLGREWRPPRLTLGIAELATVLGLVDALFALFVALQLPHLFGGVSRVREVAGLTMAEYARGGFFQLVVVAALVLPLLLGSAALVRQDEPGPWRTFQGLALVMIALVAVMIASALQRLGLYVASFGLTEERVYATAIVIWLSIILTLFIATVLRRREAGFALAALASGWVVLAALDFANPQAMVVRTNTERSVEGASFDWQYAGRLAADATPQLVLAIGRLDEAGRCSVAKTLTRVADDRKIGIPEDWRSWNASRVRAFAVANAVRPWGIVARCPGKVASP